MLRLAKLVTALLKPQCSQQNHLSARLMIRWDHNFLPYMHRRRSSGIRGYPPVRYGGRANHRPAYTHHGYAPPPDGHSSHLLPKVHGDPSRPGRRRGKLSLQRPVCGSSLRDIPITLSSHPPYRSSNEKTSLRTVSVLFSTA